MTVATRVLLLYLVVTYVPQSVLALIIPDEYATEYRGYDQDVWLKIAFMVIIAALIVLLQAGLRQAFSGFGRFGLIRFVRSFPLSASRAALQSTQLGLSIPFALVYGISFFHAGLYLSELPAWVLILQAIKPLARLDLAYCVIKALRGDRLSKFDRAMVLTNCVASAVSIAGAIDILFVVLGATLLVKRGTVLRQIFVRPAAHVKSGRVRSALYVMLISASLPAVAFLGFANKLGIERTLDLFEDTATLTLRFIVPLALRLSSSHGSFVANAELPLSLSEQLESVSYPLGNLAWRACIIAIREPCPQRGDITHTARLNYVRSYQDQSPLKAGATPGLLATVLYVPIFPLALLLTACYCALVAGCIQSALGCVRLNLVGHFLVVLFVFPAYENPLDLVIIFDPAVVYTLGFLLVLRSFASGAIRAVKIDGVQLAAVPRSWKLRNVVG